MKPLYTQEGKEITKDQFIEELAQERGYLTDKPQPQNKYWSNGALKYAPEERTKYWYITKLSLVAYHNYKHDSIDNFNLYSQNMFDTKEAAKKSFAMKKRKHEILADLLEIDKDWECDWKNPVERKYFLEFDHKDSRFDITGSHIIQKQGALYMSRKAGIHLLSDTYTDQDRAAFMEDVKLWEKFGGKI